MYLICHKYYLIQYLPSNQMESTREEKVEGSPPYIHSNTKCNATTCGLPAPYLPPAPIIHLRINGAAGEQVGIHLLQLVNILGPSSLVVVSGTIFPEWRCSDTKIDRQYNLLILMSDISLGDHKLRRWLPLQPCQKDSPKSVSICSSLSLWQQQPAKEIP